ncbi:MAG: xanthine dehydrogenase family protein molybdopterin-binding subunit [Sphingobacteriales bacterium]|nr:MAG: xanthine dehydrogenase family protein molybdopterin-binding subunit [Sphingobacteriales bacterium]
MGNYFFDSATAFEDLDRVDGKAKVTGQAKYSAEYDMPGLAYGVIVGSNITKGSIAAIDTKAAERAPGVLAVITHLNVTKPSGYIAIDETKPAAVRGLKVFDDNVIHFNGQPIALVMADTFERATHAASLIKAQYNKEPFSTSLETAMKEEKPLEGGQYKEAVRGEKDGWKNVAAKIEATYTMPNQVHNPMEMHATIVKWESDDKVTVWEKTQGVKSSQREIMQAFGLTEKNVQVHTQNVGGGFGAALRTWPHAMAALIGAKKINRPLKVVLTRMQMFTAVGYRPQAIQKISIAADAEGRLVGMTHEANAVTSNYENFTENVVKMTRQLYACPNVVTKYNLYPVELSTPTWMRGPGEATGSLPLECGLDELSYLLKMDPIELRLKNYAETDPENGKPYSSKFLKEAYQLGADKFGWKNRNPVPNSKMENGWKVGHGMSTGIFGAFRGEAKLSLKLMADGTLILQTAVSDSGPGTATAMTKIASDAMGIPYHKIKFELGDSSLPPGPTQGGSSSTSTIGAAVSTGSVNLQKKLADAAKSSPIFGSTITHENFLFQNEEMVMKSDSSKKLSYSEVLKNAGLANIEFVENSGRNPAMDKYSAYSYAVHFVKVLVHPLTGVVKIAKAVVAGDAGKIVSAKTAESQMIGGVVGGIGGALMEESVIDERYGRWINNNFADYHVPVHADVPAIEAVFVDKPDPVLNPVGSKGMGEIALIGFAAAVSNAVYNATGKRVRDLPITPDKLI